MSARSHAVMDMVVNADRPERTYFDPRVFDFEFGESRSVRKIGFGRRVSQTHQLLLTSTGRVAICESKLESDFAKIFDCDLNITDIDEQGPCVDIDGGKGKHWPDFRLTFTDGTRILVACKPDQIAQKTDFLNMVYKLGRAARKSDIADAAIWLGNSHLSLIALENAATIRRARDCNLDPHLLETVSNFLADRQFTRVQDLLTIHSNAPEAAWVAAGNGLIEPSDATPELKHNVILVQPKRAICPALRIDFGAILRQQELFISSQFGGLK